MNIAFVVYSHYSRDARVRRYAETLSRRGFKVDVICLKEEYSPKETKYYTFDVSTGAAAVWQAHTEAHEAVFRIIDFIHKLCYIRLMNLKKISKFAIKNYFLTIFVLIVISVSLIALYKLEFSKSTYVYARVKLSQGLWWSGGNKPSIWLAQAIKKGDFEKDLTGKTIVEVMGVNYYPWRYYDQFDVYLTLRLRAGFNKNTKKYSFKRSSIGIGSPIELELSSAQVSGTIMALNTQKFDDKYIDKTIILTKKSSFPWEYDVIKVGDKYFDGENTVFEVLNKNSTDTSIISTDLFGNMNSSITDLRKYIIVLAKIKVKEQDGQLIFGEEQMIQPGKQINLSTPNTSFSDYYVGEIK